MANRSKTSYEGLKINSINRSEFDDSLLRHNQRIDNRLNTEIQAVEKAERVVVKTIDQETQWFRQQLPTASSSRVKRPVLMEPGSSCSGTSGGAVVKDNSIAPNLVPDFMYRGKTFASYPSAPPSSAETANIKRPQHSTKDDGDLPETTTRESPQNNKETGLSQDREKSELLLSKSRPSRQRETKRSLEPFRPFQHKLNETVKAPTSNNHLYLTAHSVNSPTTSPSTAAVPFKSAVSRPGRAKHSGLSAVSRPHEAHTDLIVTSLSSSLHPAHRSTVRSHSHDGPDEAVTTPSFTEAEYKRSGRRRSGNLWDSLSIPKNTSTTRSIRSRLTREFTQVSTPRRSGRP